MEKFELSPFPDDRTLAEAVAGAWLEEIAVQSGRGDPYCVALSGGRIAKAFFSAVAARTPAGECWLNNVHFFWGDERCVPPDHPESNFHVARELLLNPLKIADVQIHRLRGEEPSENAAIQGEAEICRIAPLDGEGQPMLDLILLGMGEDGHVASLFPGEPEAVMASKEVYRAVTASKRPPRRITLGYGAIAAARQVWVLASGAGKQEALRDSLRPEGQTPLARVLRSRQITRIFTDLR
jgi:6-phosphogluconolactonase